MKRTAVARSPVGSVSEFDVVVLGDAAAFRLESSDAFADVAGAFFGTGPGESFGELGQGLLEARGEALDDGALLGGALFGEAVQAQLLAVVGDDFVQMYAVARCGLDAHCRLGVEVAGAFTADDEVAVVVVAQPLHAFLGGNPSVHHH